MMLEGSGLPWAWAPVPSHLLGASLQQIYPLPPASPNFPCLLGIPISQDIGYDFLQRKTFQELSVVIISSPLVSFMNVVVKETKEPLF